LTLALSLLLFVLARLFFILAGDSLFCLEFEGEKNNQWKVVQFMMLEEEGVLEQIGPTWNHCVSLDGKAINVKCNYCEKVLSGATYRLKHHLVRTSKDVGACVVPEDVI